MPLAVPSFCPQFSGAVSSGAGFGPLMGEFQSFDGEN